MSEELKPCPFCGSKAEITGVEDYDDNDFLKYTVYCTGDYCIANLKHTLVLKGESNVFRDNLYKDFDSAFEAWNKRV